MISLRQFFGFTNDRAQLFFRFNRNVKTPRAIQRQRDLAQPGEPNSNSLIVKISKDEQQRHNERLPVEHKGNRLNNPRIGPIATQCDRQNLFWPAKIARHPRLGNLQIADAKMV